MKRAPFILIVVCTLMGLFGAAATAALAAGAGWTAHHVGSGPLLSVAATDRAHAWAVGPEPSIVATSNGGATWVSQNPATTKQLYGVAFSDALDGWAVGDDGTVVATADGGAHWAPQSIPPTTAPLIGVASRGADCWAVGAGGMIVATIDGGATWLSQSSPTVRDLFSVTFADTSHGWSVGDRGRIAATIDGGVVWTLQTSPSGDYLNGVTCKGARRAWAVGEKGIIIATTDGGAHWAVLRRPAAAAPDLYTVTFADSRHGWAVGDGGVILATTNAGRTWRVQHCSTTEALASAVFPDALHGFISGTAGTMLTSTHAGWADVRPPTASATGSGWHRHGVRVVLHASDGPGGSGVTAIEYSLDRGKTWTTGSSFVVPAPANHGNDGTHAFLYRAIDNAGNVAPARGGRTGIDTRRPTPVANWSAVAIRGARASLRFWTSDPRPGSATAFVTIRVRNARGVLVKKIVLRKVKVNAARACAFTCRLPKGTYRFTVAATDAAGNPQTAQARNTLVVRDRPTGLAGSLLR